jgi:hypothetical protein
MSPESLLAEKLTVYRGAFDKACRGLFSGGEGVTVEFAAEDDDDGVPVDVDVDVVAPARDAKADVNGAFGNSNAGSKSAPAIKDELKRALRYIADDFAHEFNLKLASAVRSDPTVEMVADKYEMGPAHVEELEELLAAPVAPLVDKLDAGDLDGARRATLDVWPRLEKRIRSKWQAYFVLTFQDVSVERKAARDRKSLQPRFDAVAADTLAKAEAMRRTMPDFAAMPDERPRAMSPWIVVMVLLVLAAAGGWALVHHRNQTAAATTSEPSH